MRADLPTTGLPTLRSASKYVRGLDLYVDIVGADQVQR